MNLEGGEVGGAKPVEERRRAVVARAKRQRVDEKPGRLVEARKKRALRNRRADDDVGLRAEAVKKRGPGGEKPDERRDVGRAQRGVEAARRLRRDGLKHAPPGEPRPRGPRAVQGRAGRPGRARERGRPPVQLCIQKLDTPRVALPRREVRGLKRRRIGFRAVAGDAGVVGAREVAEEDFLGGLVGDDVVKIEDERVIVRRESRQEREEERPALEIESASILAVEQLLERSRFDARQPRIPRIAGRADLLRGLALARGEDGAKRLVPRDDATEGMLERGMPGRAAKPEDEDEVVAGAARVELVEKPKLSLSFGYRQRPVAPGARDECGFGSRLRRPDPLEEPGKAGLSKEVGQRDGCARAPPHGREQSGREQGVSAEIEERRALVRHGSAQRLAPGVRDAGREFVRVFDLPRVLLALKARDGQRAPVELAARAEREAFEHGDRGGNQLGREPRAHRGHQAFRLRRGQPGARDDMGGEQLVAAGPIERDHHRAADIALLQQRRLDLAGLDAHAADLDLEIRAPEVFEVPVRQPAREIARAIHPRARRRGERIRREPLRREFRPVEVAARDLRARDAQLAGTADRARPAAGVEHV